MQSHFKRSIHLVLCTFVAVFVVLLFGSGVASVSDVNAEEEYYTVTFESPEGYINGVSSTTLRTYQVPKGNSLSSNYHPTNCYDKVNLKGIRGWKNVETGVEISVDDISDFIPRKDTKFEAVWTDLCTVTFVSEYGGIDWSVSKKEKTFYVAKGNRVPTITIDRDPKDENVILKGWKCDDGMEYDSYFYDHVVSKNEVLTAVWEERISVTFDCTGGYLWEGTDSETAAYDIYVKKGGTVNHSMPRPTKRDYYFDGWKLEYPDNTYTIFDRTVKGTFYENVTVYAQWVEAHNVTFYSEEGYIYGNRTVTTEIDQVKIGEKVSDIPTVAGKPGCVVTGWKLAGTDKVFTKFDILDFVPEEDVTFEAVWSESITVTLDAGIGIIYNGTNNVYYRINLAKGIYDKAESFTYANCEGYVFRGWKREGSDEVFYRVPIEGTFDEDVTFNAIWVEAANVSFDPNGGYFRNFDYYLNDYLNDPKVKDYTIGKGETLVSDYPDNLSHLTDPLKDNCKFLGWKTEGSDEVYTVEQIKAITFEKDTVFTAVWGDANGSGSGNGSGNGSGSGSTGKDANTGNGANGQTGEGGQTPKYSNEWVKGLWYNADGTQTYTGVLSWKCNSTGWWVEDTTGWYPVSQWQKIDGIWYYFDALGYMASNEYYNGYWFNSDGSWDEQYYLTWESNSTGWWVEDISGWWPSSQWLKIDGYWYYFDASGYMVSNQYVDGYWLGSDGACQ